jgi:hypothetical protein
VLGSSVGVEGASDSAFEGSRVGSCGVERELQLVTHGDPPRRKTHSCVSDVAPGDQADGDKIKRLAVLCARLLLYLGEFSLGCVASDRCRSTVLCLTETHDGKALSVGPVARANLGVCDGLGQGGCRAFPVH